MKTILLKLAGPLQSWGTQSNFETRHTDLHPSKSAIIGLIGASIGYRRNKKEEIQKLNDLDFAVRVDEQGVLMRDYHIATKYKRNGDWERNYVTNRYYLQDAVFIVAIGHKDEGWIEEIYEALKRPYFQPYLGRRSLPLNADFLLGIFEDNIIDCFKKLPRQTKKGNSMNKSKLQIYGDTHLFQSRHKRMRKDWVISFNQEDRKFGLRAEGSSSVEAVEEIHDIFACIGGEHVSVKG